MHIHTSEMRGFLTVVMVLAGLAILSIAGLICNPGNTVAATVLTGIVLLPIGCGLCWPLLAAFADMCHAEQVARVEANHKNRPGPQRWG